MNTHYASLTTGQIDELVIKFSEEISVLKKQVFEQQEVLTTAEAIFLEQKMKFQSLDLKLRNQEGLLQMFTNLKSNAKDGKMSFIVDNVGSLDPAKAAFVKRKIKCSKKVINWIKEVDDILTKANRFLLETEIYSTILSRFPNVEPERTRHSCRATLKRFLGEGRIFMYKDRFGLPGWIDPSAKKNGQIVPLAHHMKQFMYAL